MNARNGLARITVDLELEEQKELKIAAVNSGISMRKMVSQAIREYLNNINKKASGLRIIINHDLSQNT